MSKLKETIARVLNISPDEITNHSSPENIESWDSFNQIMLISELEATYGIKFTMDELQRMNSVGEIKQVLRERGVLSDED
ncbi:acyl carrier protein [Candidatus Woesearchaeota archaeon]|nr:acyl carrier protein [Candidatus Woesearchaeota archaeon]RLE42238.1 MAG: acyl carrier protein [Candidatus Woesearchaeota archaeon]